MAQWQASLAGVLEMGPEHVSLYGLTLEQGTPMELQMRRGLLPEPDPDLAADMYDHARDALGQAGYEHYEISNWCLPGRPSRHNLAYWRVEPYLGIGPGAHSHLAGLRFHNKRLPNEYAGSVGRWAEERGTGRAPLDPSLLEATPTVEGHEAIDGDTAMAETLFLGLRLLEGVETEAFRERHGTGLMETYGAEVDDLTSQGLVQVDDGRLRLTSRGLLLANQVFLRFVG